MKRRLLVGVLCVMLVSMLAGCGSTMMKSAMNQAVREDAGIGMVTESVMMDKEAGLSSDSAAPQVADANRKLIKTVEMTVETKEYDEMLVGLNEQIKACGGYVEHMNTYNGSIYSGRSYSRNANMTIRVPEDKLESFLAEVTNISNVVRRSDKVDDVTLAYVDLSSHKEALQTEQKRLLELLEKAQSVEDIITIEKRLSDVRYQIESMESQLRTYDNKVSYSTVYLEIDEVKELTPVKEETVWEQISGGFVDSLVSIKDDSVEIVIWVAVNSPFLVIWAVVIIVFVLLIRRHWAKNKIKKAAINMSDSISVEDKENE
ncbi:MAG: DUF4349 domain-containing protein [Lachnospiraceae bacterium]|nr:DUF4349 domain-containing protein [Lachnospiraceae bacterium]